MSYLNQEDLALGVLERRERLQLKPGMEHVTCVCSRCCLESGDEAGCLIPSAEPQSSVLSEPHGASLRARTGRDERHGQANLRVPVSACVAERSRPIIQSTAEMDELD